MAKERGIEVFAPLGRTVVHAAPDDPGSRATLHLGLASAILAAGMVVVHGYAISAAVEGDDGRATALAWIAIVGSIVTALVGASSLIGGFGRRWGLVAVVLSVIANPLALSAVLDLFGRYATAP